MFSAITKRRKSVRKRVQKLKNPPPGPATCGTAKKDVANQKIEVKKLKNTGFFSLFACRFWTGAFTNRCLPYCFLQCFLKASVTTYQKTGGFGRKMPPPPGKPVTFLRVPSGRSRPSTFGAGGFSRKFLHRQVSKAPKLQPPGTCLSSAGHHPTFAMQDVFQNGQRFLR